MQAAADMPRPVGARCRDAAVCLALALLVASWLCAPAHGQPAHGQPAPGQPEPGLLGPEQPALEHPGPGLPAPGRPAPGRPAPGQPAPVQPAPGQPGPELPGPLPHVCGLQFNTSIDNFSAGPASVACMRARRSAVLVLPMLACTAPRWSSMERASANAGHGRGAACIIQDQASWIRPTSQFDRVLVDTLHECCETCHSGSYGQVRGVLLLRHARCAHGCALRARRRAVGRGELRVAVVPAAGRLCHGKRERAAAPGSLAP